MSTPEDFTQAGPRRLLQVCEYHAERCLTRAEFYNCKSTATYRQQAAANFQGWAELWARLAEQQALLLHYEQHGLTAELPDAQLLALHHHHHPAEPGH